MTGYRNHFVMIDVTNDPEDADAARKKVANHLDALGKALKYPARRLSGDIRAWRWPPDGTKRHKGRTPLPLLVTFRAHSWPSVFSPMEILPCPLKHLSLKLNSNNSCT